MTVAVVPASFDPITCGHVDIVMRASHLFERIVVGVYAHPKKNTLFSLEDRVTMVRESLDHVDRVEVIPYEGLTVNLARAVGAGVVVRGLRAVSDFESEFQQAALNRAMSPGLEVISMFASVEYGFLSSSIIKEIAENGGDITGMVPAPVALRLVERFPPAAGPSASGR
ncbi:MAG TPA: pantetheine-phosphate adenylyltransferase [Chloroflexota bacterium]